MKFIIAGQLTTVTYKTRNEAGTLSDVTNPVVYFYNSSSALVGTVTPVYVSTGLYKVTTTFDWAADSYRSFIFGEIDSAFIAGDTVTFRVITPANYILYAGIEEFISYAGISQRVDNGEFSLSYLKDLLFAATDRINNFCNRHFYYATVTETHFLDSQRVFFLKNYPIISISAFTVEGTTIDATEYDLDTVTGKIDFGADINQSGETVVTYKYGTAEIPQLVHFVCLQLAAYYLNRRGRESFSGESMLGYNYDYLSDPEKAILSKLDSHVLIRMR